MTVDFALDILWHAILPGLSIVLVALSGWALLTRSLVITTLEEDFMIFAEAKGLRSRTLFFRYALRNALLPQLTALGLSLLDMIGTNLSSSPRLSFKSGGFEFEASIPLEQIGAPERDAGPASALVSPSGELG